MIISGKLSRIIMLVPAAMTGFVAVPARAETTSEQVGALGNCIRLSTTGKDRIATARWLIGAIASAPQVADVAKVDAARKVEADKAMAALFTRLLAVDCAAEAKPILKNGKAEDMGEASKILGEIAMQEIMTSKATSDAVGAFANYLNEADFDALKN